MTKRFTSKRLLLTVLVMVVLISCIWAIAAAGSDTTMRLDHRVTNVSNVAFTVSWATETACGASIEYGETSSLGNHDYDDRGQDTVTRTHHILIGYLQPETTYYYDIICDDIRYDNGGKHYTVTTGPDIPPGMPQPLCGRVLKTDGETAAEGTIVYIKVLDKDGKGTRGASQEWSRLVDSRGQWCVAFGTLRTTNLSEWFEYDKNGADSVLLEFEGAAEGKASLEVPTSDAPMVLEGVSLKASE